MSDLQTLLPTKVTPKSQKFIASGTFTVPNNVFTIIVNMVGAGGGGSNYQYGSSAPYTFGGGGAGGYYQNYPLAVTPGDVLTITVGAGGTSSFISNNIYVSGSSLTAGGNTSIYKGAQELLTAYGGSCACDPTYYYYSNADYAPWWYGGGCGGAPNGSGGGGGCYNGNYTQFEIAAAGGDCGARISGTLNGGGPIRQQYYYGAIFGYGEFSNVGAYGGSSPFPAGHGATSSASLPPGENGLVVLTWFE